MSKHGGVRDHRWSVVSRLLAAIVGGYALMSLMAATLALTLPMPRIEASVTAMMVGLVAYAVIIMAVIHARSALRAWVWLIGAALPLIAVLLLLAPGARA